MPERCIAERDRKRTRSEVRNAGLLGRAVGREARRWVGRKRPKESPGEARTGERPGRLARAGSLEISGGRAVEESASAEGDRSMSSCVSGRKKVSTADCPGERLGRRKGRRGTERGIVSAKFKRSMRKRSEDGSFSEGNEEKKKRQSEETKYRKETEGKREESAGRNSAEN